VGGLPRTWLISKNPTSGLGRPTAFGDRADLALGELLEDRVRTSLRTDATDMLGSMAGDGA
jgi:hypothetical protein